MRHLLIDTDTASDDAVALLMALREPAVKVEAITVVAGNCPLATCVRNALICVEKAGTYAVPVYAGMAKPIMQELFSAEFVHGEDGMGNMGLPDPGLEVQPEHGVDIIIETAHRFAGELEIITLGPLTNLAMALLKEPTLPDLLKHVYIMGGAGLGPGNITPGAEFNFFADAEAAHLIIESRMATKVVGWDVCMGDPFITLSDISHLNSLGPLARFAVRCNATLIEYNKGWGKEGFDLPDPVTMAAALYPEIITNQFDAYGFVDYKSEKGYGQFIIDRFNLYEQPPNTTIITDVDARQWKEKLFHLLADHTVGSVNP
jgi:purine nucleosidase